MSRVLSVVALAAAFLGAALVADTAAAQTLRLGGTGGAMGMVRRIADAHAAAGLRIDIVPGLGSSGAINAVADGVIDLAVTSRPLKPKEAEKGLVAILFARTPMVWITSHPAPAGINSADIPGIFAAATPTWADGSPINIVLRLASDTDVAIVEGYVPGLAEAFAEARRRPEIPVAATDQDNAAVAEQLPGSFAHAGLSQVVTEHRNLRVVPIDGVEPTLENLESGDYPWGKPFYLVYAPGTEEAAGGLLEYLRSDQGRMLLRDAGSLPVTE